MLTPATLILAAALADYRVEWSCDFADAAVIAPAEQVVRVRSCGFAPWRVEYFCDNVGQDPVFIVPASRLLRVRTCGGDLIFSNGLE